MTDEQLLDRARKAGWEWFQGVTDRWPGTNAYPATGWLEGNGKSSFHASASGSDAAGLRPEPGRGFDHDIDCVECGAPIWLHFLSTCEDRLMCFNCNHWAGLIRGGNNIVCQRDDIDGKRHHYQCTPAKPGESRGHRWNGFGGERFVIEFLDGRIIETVNLWHQGTVPERFYDRLQVNAKLVEKACLVPSVG